jgi:drug/metabolite transporter (DMT)-like permease
LSRGVLVAGLSAGLLFAVEFLLVGESLKHTSASHVVVFLYTAPIFAALGLHWKFASERLAPFQWLGIGLAAAGIAITFFGPGSDATSPDLGSMVLGDLMALIAGAIWGSTTIVIRSTGLASIPATQTLLYQLVSAFVVLVCAAILMGQAHIDPSLALIANLAFQGVLVSFFSFLVWFWLLTKYLASQLGVFSFLTPLFGVVLGWLLLHEPVSRQFLVGSVTVLAGIVLVSGYPWFRQLMKRGSGVRTAP